MNPRTQPARPDVPAVWIAFTGLILLAVALGIGRFLLTPLLPMMQDDAGLSLVAGGWLASINNFGYLAGALICALRPLPPRSALRGGLLTIVATTLGMGLTTSVAAWLLMRLLAGIASALLMVHGIAWSMARLRAHGRHGLEALVFAGVGLGILVSGIAVAGLQPHGASSAQCWVLFGGVAALAAAAVWRVLAAPVPDTAGVHAARAPERPASGRAWTLIAAYGLLGFGYVIPATFLPLIADQHLHRPDLREWFWPLYGVATTALTLASGWLPAHADNRNLLVGCCASMAIGTVLCEVSASVGGLVVGTVLLGAVAMPVVMFVMREARRLAPADPTRLIAAATTVFGIGQIVGPLVAATLAARHGFGLPLLLAAAAVVAALLLLLHRTAPRPALAATAD